MHPLSIILPLLFLQTLGDGSQTLKVMFFGDDVIAGVHNADIDICPFRYDFLRGIMKKGEEIEVVGTNSDPEGICQKLGEGLDGHNNGYRNSGTYELLDYVAADLQYLHKPVDYIFTSLGAKDCLEFPEGGDYQIVSQSIRRVMGRLLNINDNAKIVHLPILLPDTARSTAHECMEFVNAKLREVYDFDKNHDRIRVAKLQEKYGSDSFFQIGSKPKESTPPADVVPATSSVSKPTSAEVNPETPAVVKPQATGEAEAPVKEKENGQRRVEVPLMYLPNQKLVKEIAKVLINAVDFDFRALTLSPTPDVTKEPDYYGYDWCTSNYDENVCFEYYYGYSWCAEKYGEDECYNYYYGDIDEWSPEDSYKWCLNMYDEEYCSFAYLGEEPDTWDWLNFGYHDCLQSDAAEECFDQYYGYAWCLNEYDDEECYEYYYAGKEWDEQSSYKWCVNFYTDDQCTQKYLTVEGGVMDSGSYNPMLGGVAIVALFACLAWMLRKKFTCFRSKTYSRLDMREAGEDEVELL